MRRPPGRKPGTKRVHGTPYYPPHPRQEPGLTLRRTDPLCNERIGGVAPGAGCVHQDEDNQVNQRQLTCGKGIAAVYRKKPHIVKTIGISASR